MKKFGYISLVAIVALTLQGCGGGGGDTGVDIRQYAGKYGWCDGREFTTQTLTASSPSDGVVRITSDFYQNVGCTGSIVASETPIEVRIAVTRNLGPLSVVNLAGTATQVLSVLEVSASPTQRYVVNLTGSGVFIDGSGRTCIRFSSTASTCYAAGSYPDIIEQQTITGYLSFDNNIFYSIEKSGSTYEVIEAYPKI